MESMGYEVPIRRDPPSLTAPGVGLEPVEPVDPPVQPTATSAAARAAPPRQRPQEELRAGSATSHPNRRARQARFLQDREAPPALQHDALQQRSGQVLPPGAERQPGYGPAEVRVPQGTLFPEPQIRDEPD